MLPESSIPGEILDVMGVSERVIFQGKMALAINRTPPHGGVIIHLPSVLEHVVSK